MKFAAAQTIGEGKEAINLAGERSIGYLQQSDYKVAKAMILEGMGPVQFMLMDDFHRRWLLPGKSPSVFSHEPKRLINQAMQCYYASTIVDPSILIVQK